MKERPILFSAPMVRALLAGTKTQTRRVVKPQPPADWDRNCWYSAPVWGWTRNEMPSAEWHKVRCPYGQPGDRLWVREAFSGPWCMEAQDGMAAAPPSKWGESSEIWYWADGEPTYGDWTKPRPSIHMPRWASRITLEVTEVRVERLQDISEVDARAEGITNGGCTECGNPEPCGCAIPSPDARDAFAGLWESINGPGSWEANPLVWAVSFRRITP